MREVGIKKGPWTTEEDEILANYIRREGEGRWRTLPKRAGLMRCGKSCRLRWMNYLRPSVKRGRIAPDEEDLILRLHRLLGNRWSLIAGRIPGRTDNEIKNYWNTHLSKKLISQGIDPRNHKPLKLNPSLSQVAHDIPAPNSNPNPNFCGLEETGYIPHKSSDNSNLEVTNQMSMHQNPVAAVNSNIQNLQMSHEGLMINNNEGEEEEEEDGIGYCNDEMFSSFLNSLINDDVFVINQQQLPLNAFAPSSSYSQVSSVQTTFNNGNVWEDQDTGAPIYNGCLGDVLKHRKT